MDLLDAGVVIFAFIAEIIRELEASHQAFTAVWIQTIRLGKRIIVQGGKADVAIILFMRLQMVFEHGQVAMATLRTAVVI